MSTGRSSWEPRRWSEATSDAPDELRAALQDARDTTTDSERVARLAERLGVGGGVAAGAALSNLGASGVAGVSVGSAGVGSTSAVVAYKLWAYLSGVVAVSAVTLVIWSSLGSTGSRDARRPATLVAAQDDGASVVDRPAPDVPLQVPTVSAPAMALVEPSAATQRPAARVAARRRTTATEATSRTDPAHVSGKLDPAAELTILNSAQAALAQAPRRALTLTDDHASAFPRGVFAQEREVIAIEALIKLQRSDEATTRGRVFMSTFPTSTHAPRVQHMLGE